MKNSVIDEKHKLREFTYEETLKLVEMETPEFLAEYIYKINKTYNLLIDRIIKLQNDNKSLKGEIKVHAKNSNNRYNAIKIQEKRIAKLNREAQRYFDMLMDECQNEYRTRRKYHKALQLLGDDSMPCEMFDYDCKKSGTYCNENYKKCWNRYIEQELENEE